MQNYINTFFGTSTYNRVYTLFILKLLAIYFVWEYILRAYVYDMEFNKFININLAYLAGWVLRFFGFNATNVLNVVHMNGSYAVGVGTVCNGISFIGVIGGLTFSTPTSLKNKLLFFPLIGVCIYITNIFRIAMLAYTWKYNHLSFEFNHKFLYLYTIYAVIFVIWYVWFQKVSLKREKL